MARVPRVRKAFMNISEKHDRQHYFGVLITPQKHHFTKTDSLMVVEGTEMKDDDVGKYLCQYLEGERYGGGDEINFYGLIEIQWLMLLAIGHHSVEEAIRIDERISMLALKWEGNDHQQTKLINEAFRTKAYKLGDHNRWLTHLDDEHLNVLQEYEFRHCVVGLSFYRHGDRPDRIPREEGEVRDGEEEEWDDREGEMIRPRGPGPEEIRRRKMLFGQFDYASSTLPEEPGYELGDINHSTPGIPMPPPMETGAWGWL